MSRPSRKTSTGLACTGTGSSGSRSGSTAMPRPPTGCAGWAGSTRRSRHPPSWTSSARSSSTWASPPVYDRAALALSEKEKERLRAERGDGVWRFKLDHERIEWEDGILGPVSIDAASVSDPVLIRGDGQVLYTLASVVDDTEMGVTHVVRGSDHVTNTATQIQIIEALGGTVPPSRIIPC